MDKYENIGAGFSLEDFRHMVMTFTPEQLAAIPLDQLPDNIPEELLNEAPVTSRSVVEDFIFELNTREIHLQMEFAERFPPGNCRRAKFNASFFAITLSGSV